jgi:hypothetical protein
VTDEHVKVDSCAPVPYASLRSGVAAASRDLDEWHEFVLELQARTDAEAYCIGDRILVFSIPAHLVCHADITDFRDRTSLDARKIGGSNGWFKKDCQSAERERNATDK